MYCESLNNDDCEIRIESMIQFSNKFEIGGHVNNYVRSQTKLDFDFRILDGLW